MKLTVRELAVATGGNLVEGDPGRLIKRISIDTRDLEPGDWFVPLKGERTDGHRFISEAFRKGAGGVFTAQDLPRGTGSGAIIRVDDTLGALQGLAGYYRRRFDAEVIGVTGSSGKTTTKDLVATVLGSHFNLLKTSGNYNNHIGLPLTLLGLNADHRVAVLEMAMRGPGEIAHLARIAVPRWAVITNIGTAHFELLGSVENIARAKGEILENLGDGGSAILNGDDPHLRKLGQGYRGQVFYYGWEKNVDFRAFGYANHGGRASFEAVFPDGRRRLFELPLPGKHNVSNALAALALGFLFKIDVDALNFDLWDLHHSPGRLRIMEMGGLKIIDDTYNANPASTKASIEVMQEMEVAGLKIAVLGDMLELGGISEDAHREVGRKIIGSGIDYLITIGEQARFIAEEVHGGKVKTRVCKDREQAWSKLQDIPIVADSMILFKGSRGMELEKMIHRLKKYHGLQES
ncbi:MAG: UDP-N-acetylmuramoyl-tripeptide--D-alanyl-D-alanine ligase [Firmicutes bacterium]|nr:UDP-N-acetylmuramoyl-tripeptide--D-alanyl-D-alanine ligase [Bacillota bacterium]